MSTNFKKYLEKNFIHISQGIENSVPRELDAARNDLAAARRSLEVGDYKWGTAQAFHSMFHAGRTLLYLEGYKEKGCQALIGALESLYVENGRLSNSSLKKLRQARHLRDTALDNLEYSKDTAELLLAGAKRFVEEAQSILKS